MILWLLGQWQLVLPPKRPSRLSPSFSSMFFPPRQDVGPTDSTVPGTQRQLSPKKRTGPDCISPCVPLPEIHWISRPIADRRNIRDTGLPILLYRQSNSDSRRDNGEDSVFGHVRPESQPGPLEGNCFFGSNSGSLKSLSKGGQVEVGQVRAAFNKTCSLPSFEPITEN